MWNTMSHVPRVVRFALALGIVIEPRWGSEVGIAETEQAA